MSRRVHFEVEYAWQIQHGGASARRTKDLTKVTCEHCRRHLPGLQCPRCRGRGHYLGRLCPWPRLQQVKPSTVVPVWCTFTPMGGMTLWHATHDRKKPHAGSYELCSMGLGDYTKPRPSVKAPQTRMEFRRPSCPTCKCVLAYNTPRRPAPAPLQRHVIMSRTRAARVQTAGGT